MANPLDANELIKQGQTRTFYQPGGPGTNMYFFGLDTSYHFIDSAEMPSNGTIDPVFVPDPRRPNRYKLVARQIGAPDLPTVSLVFHEQWGGIPRALMAPKCEFNLYEVHSRCADLSDFYRGWDSYVLIYSGFRFEAGIDLGTRTAADSDEGLTANIDAKGAAIYPVGALGFGEEASTEVTKPVVDVVYGTSITCGDCGVENDGSKFIYAVQARDAGNDTVLTYSVDGGITWTNITVVDNNADLDAKFIDIAGSTLFIGFDNTDTPHDSVIYYNSIEPLTGEFVSATWSHFDVSGVTLSDVWVKSSRSIWFSAYDASDGFVYKTSDITTAPTLITILTGNELYRIAGANDTVVACGGDGTNGKLIFTKNGGATWTSVLDTDMLIKDSAGSAIPDLGDFKALAVLDDRVWYVGTASSYLVYTKTGALKWSRITMSNEGVATYSINDIAFPTREVAWIAQNKSTSNQVGNLFTTIDGGNTIVKYDATSRIQNYPSSSIYSINRIGVPYLAEPAIAANYLTLGGYATSTTGILVSAAPTIV
jgi:photosystem II stability/assembly factor-like uncharacterized protein